MNKPDKSEIWNHGLWGVYTHILRKLLVEKSQTRMGGGRKKKKKRDKKKKKNLIQ